MHRLWFGYLSMGTLVFVYYIGYIGVGKSERGWPVLAGGTGFCHLFIPTVINMVITCGHTHHTQLYTTTPYHVISFLMEQNGDTLFQNTMALFSVANNQFSLYC